MRSALRTILIFSAAAALGAGAGCGQAGNVVAGREAPLAAEEASPAFLDRISSAPRVTENDAARGLLLLLDGKDPHKTFGQRVEALRARGIVDETWAMAAGQPLTKGRLAYMIYQGARMTGGVVLTVTTPLIGPTQRYCLRNLQYRGMVTKGTLGAPVTGMEFVAVLTRADSYIRTGKIPGRAGSTDGP